MCVTVCLIAWTDIALIRTDSFVVDRDGQASGWSMLSDLQKHYSEPIKEKVWKQNDERWRLSRCEDASTQIFMLTET